MLEILVILLLVTAALSFLDWRRDVRRRRQVTLKIVAVQYLNKPKT